DDRSQSGHDGSAERQRFQGGGRKLHGEAAAEVYGEVGGIRRQSVFALRATQRQPSLVLLRGTVRACRAVAREASEGWWSQAGSNRRPRHCERRALPAELWPLL